MRIVRNLGAALLSLTLLLTTASSAAAVPTLLSQRVLILGTSTTACSGPTDPALCYTERLRAARSAVPMTVIGRAGTYTGWGPMEQNWSQQVIPSGFSVVVLQHGTNDWYVPVPTAEEQADVTSLLQRTHAANPYALLVWVRTWMPAVSAANWTARKAVWDAHGAVQRDAVQSFGGVWLDLDPTGTGGVGYRADETGWHYNNAGHGVIAARILPYLPTRTGPARR